MKKAALFTGLLVLAGLSVAPLVMNQSSVVADSKAVMASGFEVGEQLPPFDVVDVTGPNKGKQLCYR